MRCCRISFSVNIPGRRLGNAFEFRIQSSWDRPGGKATFRRPVPDALIWSDGVGAGEGAAAFFFPEADAVDDRGGGGSIATLQCSPMEFRCSSSAAQNLLPRFSNSTALQRAGTIWSSPAFSPRAKGTGAKGNVEDKSTTLEDKKQRSKLRNKNNECGRSSSLSRPSHSRS